MDTFEQILTKLDIRQFSPRTVSPETKLKVLEAARSTGTAMNRQHLRFILVQDKEAIKKLAEDSSTGGWVAGANFAVVVVTEPKPGYTLIDTGRAVQDMQLAAWSNGIVSCVYSGFKDDAMRRDFGIPSELRPTMAVGFGYPTRKILGKKNRKPLTELAYVDKFGNTFDQKKLV